MPTYEYACTSCGERLEVVQKFSDDPLSVCPACDGALRKVFSPVGVVFKGSGFYKTDSRKPAGGASAAASGAGTDAGSAGAGSAEPKPGGDAKPAGDPKPAAEAKPAADGAGGSTKASSAASGEKVA